MAYLDETGLEALWGDIEELVDGVTISDGGVTTAKLADGAVTDAKLAQSGGVLESIARLNDSIDEYNSVEYLGKYADGTGSRSGISYSVSNGVFSMSGTATASGYIVRLYYNTSTLPAWFKSGMKLTAKLNKTGNMDKVTLLVTGYYDGGSSIIANLAEDAKFEIPSTQNWIGAGISLYINNTNTCNGTIKPQLFNAATNEELERRVIAIEGVSSEIPDKLEKYTFDSYLYYEGVKQVESYNLLNPDAVMHGYSASSNTGLPAVNQNSWFSDFMPVNTGDLVTVTVNGVLTTLNAYCTYDSDKAFNSGGYHDYIKETTVADSNTAYIRVACRYTICDPRVDLIQIKIGPTADYKPYGAWFTSGTIQKTVIIAPSGGDYASIRTAFETEGENTEFLIYPGTYNVANDFTAEEISNASYDSAGSGFVGVRVKNGSIVRGVGDKRNIIIKCELDATQYTYTKRGNIATLNLFGDCTIENLTVLAVNARTPIHDDFAANIGKTHIIRDCVLRNEVSERTTSHGYGLGLLSGESVIMEGCDIYPTMICHSNNNFAKSASLKMVDCNVYSNLSLQDLTSGAAVYIDLINSTYGCLIYTSNNTAKAMQIRIASKTDAPICLTQDADICGFMYNELPARYAVQKGQLVAYSRTGNFNSTDMYRVASTTDQNMAIGIAKNDAAIDSAVKIVKLGAYIGSYECGIASVALGDHIGVGNDGKLAVDANGTFGVVVLMVSDGIGIIKRL